MKPWKEFVQESVEKTSEKLFAMVPMETQMKLMGGAMSVAQKGTQALEQLKVHAAPLVARSADFRESMRRPRLLGPAVEEQAPWFTNAFLSAASNLQEPFLAGRGMRVKTWTDSAVEVEFPRWLLTSDENGGLHSGAVSVLAETAARLFWERALDPRFTKLELVEVHVRFFKNCKGTARACVSISEGEREKILRELRVQELGQTEGSVAGTAQQEIEVRVLDEKDQLVASVHTNWKVEQLKTLSAAGGN